MRNYKSIISNRDTFMSQHASEINKKIDKDIKNALKTITSTNEMIAIVNIPQVDKNLIQLLEKKGAAIEEVDLESMFLGVPGFEDLELSVQGLETLDSNKAYYTMAEKNSPFIIKEQFNINVKYNFRIVFSNTIKLSELKCYRILYSYGIDKYIWFLFPSITIMNMSDLLLSIDGDIINLNFTSERSSSRGLSSLKLKEISIRIGKNNENSREILTLVKMTKDLLRFENICLEILLNS